MVQTLSAERGQGRLKLIIALAITAALVLAAVRIIPVFVRSYEFQDAVREEAKFARVRPSDPVSVRGRLLEKADEIGLELAPEQIQVTPARDGIQISVRYSVPVQLPGYSFTLNFQASADTASAY